MSTYALNLFNVQNADEYLAYTKGAQQVLEKYGARVVALGQLRAAPVGDISPRQVMMLVEWTSKEGLQGYIHDPETAQLHPHREKGLKDFVWHLFDRIEDLEPVLRAVAGSSE